MKTAIKPAAKKTTAKPAVATPVVMGTRLSAVGELRVLKKVAAELKKNPALLRQATVEAGIYTQDGRLRKAFGGTAR